MHYVFLLGVLFITVLSAGTTKQVPASSPASVIERHAYVGAGYSSFVLQDEVTEEELSSGVFLLLVGYQFTENFSLEGRFYRNTDEKIDYDPGNRPSPHATYKSTFSNSAVFLKASYPISKFEVYGLLGYGRVKLTNIAGGDREESGVQYGLGLSYRVSAHVDIFADWVRAYDDSGFDGRAKNDGITVNLLSFGMRYLF